MEPVIGYLKPYKKAIYATAVFVLLDNAIQLALPVVYGRVVDVVTKGIFFERSVFLLLAAWLVGSLMSGWFGRIRERRSYDIGFQVSTDLTVKSVDRLSRLPMGFHKSQKVGELLERFARADMRISDLASEGIFEILPSLLTSFLAFVIIAWMNGWLAAIYALFIMTYFTVTVKKTEPVIRCQKAMNRIFEKTYGDIFDRTPNVISIKSNVAEDYEHGNNICNFRKGRLSHMKQMRLWSEVSLWQDIVYSASFLALFASGMYLVSIGKVTIGQFVMLLGYVGYATAAIGSLGSRYKQFQESLVTIERAHKIFSETMENYDDPKAEPLESCQGEVEFRDVSFSYDKEKVLDGISFKAEPGRMIAIVGKSGEGKSTLVDLISLYNVPTKGRILLDGKDTRKIRLGDLRRQIAIVPQEIDLFNDTIRNNIAYSKREATEEEIIAAAKAANCHDFIMEFPKKYSQVVGDKGVKLSTGQKQRIAIARAILRDPRILILDEATSALDSESEMLVQEALHGVMKGRTTFVIAHRLSTIRKADLILVIENGRIIESGDHKELIEKGGVYRKLTELQQVSV